MPNRGSKKSAARRSCEHLWVVTRLHSVVSLDDPAQFTTVAEIARIGSRSQTGLLRVLVDKWLVEPPLTYQDGTCPFIHVGDTIRLGSPGSRVTHVNNLTSREQHDKCLTRMRTRMLRQLRRGEEWTMVNFDSGSGDDA